MKIPLTVTVGGATFEALVEVPDDILRPAPAESDAFDNAELCERWRCSSRTLGRLRDAGRLPFSKPSPRKFLYRRADVEALEEQNRVGVLRLVAGRAAR